MSRLRRIALVVEQTGRNQFAWLLTESADGRATVLKKGMPCSSYMSALDAGHDELAQLLAPEGGELAELHDAP